MRFSVQTVALAVLVAGGSVVACGDDDGTTNPPVEEETGSVEVTVESDGSAESGVTVQLFETGGTSALETESTGSDGTAAFDDLDPGTYEVEVEVPEGRELVEGEEARKSVTVTVGQTSSVDFELEPADEGTVVEVLLTADLTFEPSDVTIDPGTTIRWRNEIVMSHTVTPDNHDEWTSASLSSADETFQHTFNNEGDFEYFCQPHAPNMRGVIRVQE